MRSQCQWLAGLFVAGLLASLTSGCGGANDALKEQPVVKENPPMTAMPGYDEKTGKMKTNKTN